MEMTRPGGTVATPNLKVDPSQALGNPHRTRVPTFPQRRRRLDSYEARSRTPLESWAPSDSCTEPQKRASRSKERRALNRSDHQALVRPRNDRCATDDLAYATAPGIVSSVSVPELSSLQT